MSDVAFQSEGERAAWIVFMSAALDAAGAGVREDVVARAGKIADLMLLELRKRMARSGE